MDTKPFELGRPGSDPNDWINSTVDIAVNILVHRLKTLKFYKDGGKKVNDLITRELLGRSIWKYSEAYGKFKGCPFWSVKAYNLFFKQKTTSVGILGKYLRHEHTFPQRLLIEKMWSLKDPTTDNHEVRNAKSITIKTHKKIKFNLLYDKNRSLQKKIKIEQLRGEIN